MGLFDIYKRGQGRYARVVTFVAAMVIGLGGASALSDRLAPYVPPLAQYGIPALALALLAAAMFWIVNRPKSADFLIATEGEMKKVSWSSKKEIVGSTKVVVVAMFILAGVLYAVDIAFAVLFASMGVTGD